MSDKLAAWINIQLKENGWSIREFSRRVGISHTHAARIINAEVIPSAEICSSIARVFKVSPVTVLIYAGLLQERTENTRHRQELLYLFEQLNDNTQETVLTMLRGYVRETTPAHQSKASVSEA